MCRIYKETAGFWTDLDKVPILLSLILVRTPAFLESALKAKSDLKRALALKTNRRREIDPSLMTHALAWPRFRVHTGFASIKFFEYMLAQSSVHYRQLCPRLCD